MSTPDIPLPGMEEAEHGESQLVVATRRTITALADAGYLDETHAVLCRLMMELAAVVDSGVRSGKASAAAMAGAQILAAYQVLVPQVGGESSDEFSELVAEIRRSAAAGRNPI